MDTCYPSHISKLHLDHPIPTYSRHHSFSLPFQTLVRYSSADWNLKFGYRLLNSSFTSQAPRSIPLKNETVNSEEYAARFSGGMTGWDICGTHFVFNSPRRISSPFTCSTVHSPGRRRLPRARSSLMLVRAPRIPPSTGHGLSSFNAKFRVSEISAMAVMTIG